MRKRQFCSSFNIVPNLDIDPYNVSEVSTSDTHSLTSIIEKYKYHPSTTAIKNYMDYGCSNGAKFSLFYNLCSVLNYLRSVSSYLYSVSSYIYSIRSHIYSIRSHIYSVWSYLYLVSSYFIQFSLLCSVSHTVQEDIVPQILSCSRFRNNQIELTKRQIQKYENTENRILNSNKK